jgi:hypothetical protein
MTFGCLFDVIYLGALAFGSNWGLKLESLDWLGMRGT